MKIETKKENVIMIRVDDELALMLKKLSKHYKTDNSKLIRSLIRAGYYEVLLAPKKDE